MRTLRFTEEDIGRGPLILVNPSHPVRNGESGNRLAFVDSDPAGIRLEIEAARRFSEITAVLNCNRDIVPVGGYRTPDDQRKLYADSLREHGEEFTKNYVALPGCSEHQTGLAVDLAENGSPI